MTARAVDSWNTQHAQYAQCSRHMWCIGPDATDHGTYPSLLSSLVFRVNGWGREWHSESSCFEFSDKFEKCVIV